VCQKRHQTSIGADYFSVNRWVRIAPFKQEGTGVAERKIVVSDRSRITKVLWPTAVVAAKLGTGGIEEDAKGELKGIKRRPLPGVRNPSAAQKTNQWLS